MKISELEADFPVCEKDFGVPVARSLSVKRC